MHGALIDYTAIVLVQHLYGLSEMSSFQRMLRILKRRLASLTAAVQRVAEGIGPSELKKITTAGFDSGGQSRGLR